MVEDFERCYRAMQARDPRFDGWFFAGVTTTGIYCRPSCPARTPGRDHVRFFPSAAAAQRADFRACLRCRPDAVPGSPEWDLRGDLAARALRLIADGVVDREGVTGLARRLHYGTRQLHRMLAAEVGAGPLALARAQRIQRARVLVETTRLPIADVAFAAGFASVRQFNDTMRHVLGRTPTELRSGARRGARPDAQRHGGGGTTRSSGAITLRLACRQPIAAAEVLAFLGARAVEGIEHADGTAYARSLRLPHGHGRVELALEKPSGHDRGERITARLALADLRDLGPAVERCRRLLDLDADPEAVDTALASDAALRPLVVAVPGRRVPGTVDGFELAVRAIAGQQLSLQGARAAVARLVSSAGPAIDLPFPAFHEELDRVFPSPGEVLDAADDAFAMPAARREAVRSLAVAVQGERLALDRGDDRAAVVGALQSVRGIGPWTVGTVAMRALGDPDVFLHTDGGVTRGLARTGLPSVPRAALAAADRWRPWRSYAVVHLWGGGREHAHAARRVGAAPGPAMPGGDGEET